MPGTNQGQGLFVDEKSKRVLETYTRLKENHTQSSGSARLSQGSSTFIPEVWAEATLLHLPPVSTHLQLPPDNTHLQLPSDSTHLQLPITIQLHLLVIS
ncbi:hypothetical protein BUALT_Bualt14G0004400 [Buddleja alternifolia]|uniref:Uncharacterized protein n=1 Tax=Buddleja alternifolia TaxID=168488 RepID=A0AAV6WLS2_9LAMI|nr:hypothetical protein BUALT_Bualt14G0004400 [Buddleja alternifolia]